MNPFSRNSVFNLMLNIPFEGMAVERNQNFSSNPRYHFLILASEKECILHSSWGVFELVLTHDFCARWFWTVNSLGNEV